jgi:hypothetical protein
VSDLEMIVAQAEALPLLEPEHDLWRGIEARIEAPVVALETRISGEHRVANAPPAPVPKPVLVPSWRRFAIAASVLVALTAGVTWQLAQPRSTATVATAPAPAPLAGAAKNVNRPTAEQTYDREIAALRTLVDQRRTQLDTATVAVLEKNLKLIDQAIAESKAALAKDPASGFLNDRLNEAYDTKLQLLRGVATIPLRS